jgi:hypothetical protein
MAIQAPALSVPSAFLFELCVESVDFDSPDANLNAGDTEKSGGRGEISQLGA